MKLNTILFFDIYKCYLYYLVKSLSTIIILDEIVFCIYIYICILYNNINYLFIILIYVYIKI